MSKIILPSLPFPNLYWWSNVLNNQQPILDNSEAFQKMTFRNAYMIATSNGVLQLSIPIEDGRQQKKQMKDIKIYNDNKWQKQHYRSILSAYNKSPFFEYFHREIEIFYAQRHDFLFDFNQDSVQLVMQLARIKNNLNINTEPWTLDDNDQDMRRYFKKTDYTEFASNLPRYHQVFEERAGFLSNLSILDLLFNEGNNIQGYFSTVE